MQRLCYGIAQSLSHAWQRYAMQHRAGLTPNMQSSFVRLVCEAVVLPLLLLLPPELHYGQQDPRYRKAVCSTSLKSHLVSGACSCKQYLPASAVTTGARTRCRCSLTKPLLEALNQAALHSHPLWWCSSQAHRWYLQGHLPVPAKPAAAVAAGTWSDCSAGNTQETCSVDIEEPLRSLLFGRHTACMP